MFDVTVLGKIQPDTVKKTRLNRGEIVTEIVYPLVVTSPDHEIGLFHSIAALEGALEPPDVDGCRVFSADAREFNLSVEPLRRRRSIFGIGWTSEVELTKVRVPTVPQADSAFLRDRLVERIRSVAGPGSTGDGLSLAEIVVLAEDVLGEGFT